MRWYPDRIPHWIPKVFKGLTWHKSRARKEIYLTFDDGPTPIVTDKVLEILRDYGVKATFFCIGDCVKRHPDIYQRLLDQGHRVGNHTFNHLNAWKTSWQEYLDNTGQAAQLISSNLFRPPYGKITSSVVKKLKSKGYKVVMWDVLSGDFDTSRSASSCLENLKKNTRNGSIVVFHDSEKAQERLLEILPEYLEFLKIKEITCTTF
ncbi:polysaccharide deacetylase family protein [Nonlabens spongiae]|uniref:Polysaccharide deacetylase family protein n=1 Tax=Nonlabens spongiae TaxID=331648 RepID=A0A1W6ML02_9FLAO|nr:polysaccharide deacetylase family protein [Nonlabens spongiae]ARN78275.1 polysaccharide deacetylase family protein [Nonlabens spongiae]